jgi:ADP-heptose:LPS heptosyltransferase
MIIYGQERSSLRKLLAIPLTYRERLSIILPNRGDLAKRGIMPLEELHGMHGGRILVVHQGALGDLILALPAIKALREFLQPVWLEMMGHPWTLTLAHGHPYADAIMDINRGDMAPFFQETAPLPAGMSAHLGGFDAAFYFGRSTTLARNLRRAGIRRIFILPPFPAQRTHVIDHHFQSLQALGIFPPPSPPRIFLPEKEREEARGFFLQRGWDLNAIVALHPGAGSRKKAWPPHRFAALGRVLAAASKKLLICQGPADEDAVRAVRAGLDGIPHLLVHDKHITSLAALLSCVSLFIGNDSGISHLAAALGVPTIAIFGPTDPLCWAPRGDRAFWLQGKAACAPCARDQQRNCERQQCLEGIEVEAVMAFITEKKMMHHTAACHQGRPLGRETLPHLRQGEEGMSLPPP